MYILSGSFLPLSRREMLWWWEKNQEFMNQEYMWFCRRIIVKWHIFIRLSYFGKVITCRFYLEIKYMIDRKEKRYSIKFQTIDVQNCYIYCEDKYLKRCTRIFEFNLCDDCIKLFVIKSTLLVVRHSIDFLIYLLNISTLTVCIY